MKNMDTKKATRIAKKIVKESGGKVIHFSQEDALVIWHLEWKNEYVVHRIVEIGKNNWCLEHGNYFNNIDEAMLDFLKRKGLIKEPKNTVWKVSQLSIHGEHLCDFGYFDSKKLAIDSFMKGFDELYSGFREDVYSNGINQWITDKHDFVVNLSEIELNIFEEV